MNIRKHFAPLSFILLLAVSCAKQTSPTGGPKDKTPPKLVSSNPSHGTVNFKGEGITLQFDELIQLNNPKEEILVTPSIGNEFEVKAKRNTVQILFNTELEANTTYNINFRDAIQDITERNPTKNLQLAFSTGPYLDSLTIKGKVFDLLTGKPVEDATVAIHPPIDTFSIFDHTPNYLTKTNKQGQYTLDNLKPGTYYPYAILDKNRNLRADTRSEKYAFSTTPLQLSADTSSINLYLLKLDARPLAVTSARPYNTYFNIKTTKSLTTFQVTAPDSSTLYYGFGEDQSNIRIYNTHPTTDSLLIHITGLDSIGFQLDTALYMKFLDRPATPESFTFTVNQSSLLTSKGLLHATLTFSKPLKSISFDSLYYWPDSSTIIPIEPTDLQYDEPKRRLTIRKNVPPVAPKPQSAQQALSRENINRSDPQKTQKTPELIFGRGTFISAENDSSNRLVHRLEPLAHQNLAWIIFDIRTEAPSFIVQLLDGTGNVVAEQFDVPKGRFEDLKAANYTLRVIIDDNKNRKWDPGNYYTQTPPEMIHHYTDETGKATITTKQNFEIQLRPMLITP